MNWRDKFVRFMYGRYGIDELGNFLFCVIIGLCISSLFVRSHVVDVLLYTTIIIAYFRMFSRNTYKRSYENEKYIRFRNKLKMKWGNRKVRAEQRKTYKFFKCPNCRQTIRIPKGHGKIEIRCPKCHEKFIRRS